MPDTRQSPPRDTGPFAMFLPLARSVRRIALFTLFVGVLTSIFVLIAKPRYSVSVSLLPAVQPAPGAALGLLGSMAVSELGLGMQEMGPDRFVDVLNSSRVFTNVAYRTYRSSDGSQPQNLISWYEYSTLDSGEAIHYTLERLRTKTDISISRVTGLITVTVEDGDPKIAAQIAQAFVDELVTYTEHVFATTAHLRSEFLMRRVGDIKDSLGEAERELLQFSEENMNVGLSPRLNLQRSRLVAQVEFYRSMYTSLNVDYERARSEEIRQQLIVNVLDKPMPPTVRSWPRRTKTVLLSTVVAAILSVAWVYLEELLRRWRKEPGGQEALAELRATVHEQLRLQRHSK